MPQEPTVCNCPKCGKAFKVPPEFLGKKITCKACQTGFLAAAAKPAAPPTAAAPPPIPVATGNPPVTAATTAPAAVTPPSDDLGLIPFDDGLVTQATVASGAARPASDATTAKEGQLDKVKLDIKGHYFVLKLFLASKSAQKDIERLLNEYAEDGWRLIQILQLGDNGLAILHRDPANRTAHDESESSKAAATPES
jgi:hypothetical protein